MGFQVAGVIPPQLFAGQPAHALNKTAFHLPQVDGRVQRATGIVQDIDCCHPALTGQAIDSDFADGGTVGEIIKGAALGGFAVVVNLRCTVKAGGRQLYPCQVGKLHQLGKR